MGSAMGHKEKDIVYEDGPYFATKARYGFDVWLSGVTHATRCAIIGFKGDEGLQRAKDEIERRKKVFLTLLK